MRSRLLLLILLGTALCTQPASAAVPSPVTSVVDPCLIVCPSGDFAFHVAVRDIANSPVPGASVLINLCQCPSVHLCEGSCDVVKLADAAGNVTFNIKAGGVCQQGVTILADGVLLAGRLVASTDQNGDLVVNNFDEADVLSKFGSTDLTADLNCSGSVDSADLTVDLSHDGHNCEVVPTLPQSWGRTKAIYR